MTITQVSSQAGGATNDSAASITRAYAGNVTSGNLIWVACAKNENADFVAGNATKSAGTATIGAVALDSMLHSGDMVVGVWSALVTGTGSFTWSVAAGAGTYFSMGSDELASDVGWDASRKEDSDSATGASLTQETPDMVSAGKAAFVGGVTSNNSTDFGTWTQDAAFTRIYRETNGTLHQPGLFMQRIVSTGTTDRVTATNSVEGDMNFVVAGVVYKEIANANVTVGANGSASTTGAGTVPPGTSIGL